MDTAQSIIEQLTCLNLEVSKTPVARVYDVRDGFSTVFTDLFQDVTSVTDGTNPVSYTAMFWGNRNTKLKNSIVLDDCQYVKEVTVTATWKIPDDLQAVIDNLDALLTATSGKTSRVKSKKVEDFSITMNDNTEIEQFILDNKAIIDKYSICGVGNVRNGSIC